MGQEPVLGFLFQKQMARQVLCQYLLVAWFGSAVQVILRMKLRWHNQESYQLSF